MNLGNPRALALFGTSAASTIGYVLLARAVARGKTRGEDRKLRRDAQAHVTPRAERLAETTGHIGKWYTHLPASLLGAAMLAYKRRYVAAGSIVATSLGATALSHVLDHVHDQPTPPPGKQPDEATFPSGHALETTAVSVASSWVVAREQVAPAGAVAPLALVASLVSGLGRLVVDRHWTSDAVAGYLAGSALGTAVAGVYELVRGND